ncbi:unnamed protein product [marine sediment metagenome]|uniref:Uncharacterized protein n=1 Tax=marine sediment metagenome TaxID=412755 RepID=X0VYN6_9ZZZZ
MIGCRTIIIWSQGLKVFVWFENVDWQDVVVQITEGTLLAGCELDMFGRLVPADCKAHSAVAVAVGIVKVAKSRTLAEHEEF